MLVSVAGHSLPFCVPMSVSACLIAFILIRFIAVLRPLPLTPTSASTCRQEGVSHAIKAQINTGDVGSATQQLALGAFEEKLGQLTASFGMPLTQVSVASLPTLAPTCPPPLGHHPSPRVSLWACLWVGGWLVQEIRDRVVENITINPMMKLVRARTILQ